MAHYRGGINLKIEDVIADNDEACWKHRKEMGLIPVYYGGDCFGQPCEETCPLIGKEEK